MGTTVERTRELVRAPELAGAMSCVLLAGSGSARLGARVAPMLGVPLGAATTERFPDGELSVTIGESVRDREVLVVQGTGPPVNDNLFELFAFADACRRAAAARIVAVVPYFGYARADRRQGRRVPVTARMVADLVQMAGIDHVITVDVHTPQIEGFFRVPVDVLTAVPALSDALRPAIANDAVVVAPDLGGVHLARDYSARLGLPMAACNKQRISGTAVEITQITGEVRGRQCVIVDDMISTAGTICASARALAAAGALPPFTVAATHGVLVSGALDRMREAGVDQLFITDTIERRDVGDPLVHVVSVAPMLAAAMHWLVDGERDDTNAAR